MKKKGSFEGYCSGGGITQYGMGSAKEIAIAARNNITYAKEIYKEMGHNLGRGLSYLIDILNPEVIIIGSIYTRSQDLIDPYMYEILEKETLQTSLNSVKILPALLGNEIGDKAALGVAYEGYKTD